MTVNEKVVALAVKVTGDMADTPPRLLGRHWCNLRFSLNRKITLSPGEDIPEKAMLNFVCKVGVDGLLFMGLKGIGLATAKQLFREAQEIKAAQEGAK